MMSFDLLQVTLLALIQGLTEFLPVSSSAHLILPSALFGWDDQGLAFDVAVHLGTLLAVIFYFRHEISNIFLACCKNIAGHGGSEDSRMGWMIIVATLPTVITGLVFKDFIDEYLRQVAVIATTTIVFGILLLCSDLKSKHTVLLKQMNWKTCIVIGLSQVLALIPGTSRSGITITAALFCNLDRESASKFSFLLSIPVIAGASLLLGVDLLEATEVNWLMLSYAMFLAAITAFCFIHFFLKVIKRIGFLPFVIYRLLLGFGLFLYIII